MRHLRKELGVEPPSTPKRFEMDMCQYFIEKECIPARGGVSLEATRIVLPCHSESSAWRCGAVRIQHDYDLICGSFGKETRQDDEHGRNPQSPALGGDAATNETRRSSKSHHGMSPPLPNDITSRRRSFSPYFQLLFLKFSGL